MSRRGLSTISHVYRLHHAPIVPITLKSLIDRGPNPLILNTNWNEVSTPSAVIERAHQSQQHLIHIVGRYVAMEMKEMKTVV